MLNQAVGRNGDVFGNSWRGKNPGKENGIGRVGGIKNGDVCRRYPSHTVIPVFQGYFVRKAEVINQPLFKQRHADEACSHLQC